MWHKEREGKQPKKESTNSRRRNNDIKKTKQNPFATDTSYNKKQH